jgi:hypothetical protein
MATAFATQIGDIDEADDPQKDPVNRKIAVETGRGRVARRQLKQVTFFQNSATRR